MESEDDDLIGLFGGPASAPEPPRVPSPTISSKPTSVHRKRPLSEMEKDDVGASMDELYQRKRKRRKATVPRWAKLSPELAPQMNAADRAFQRGDYAAAKSAVDAVLAGAKHYAAAWYLLSEIFLRLEDFERALVALQFFIGVRYPGKTIAIDEEMNRDDSGDDDDDDRRKRGQSAAADGREHESSSESETLFGDELRGDRISQSLRAKQTPAHLIEQMMNLATITGDYKLAVRCLTQVLSHSQRRLDRMQESENVGDDSHDSEASDDARAQLRMDKIAKLRERILKMHQSRFEFYDKMGATQKGLKDIYYVFKSMVNHGGHPLSELEKCRLPAKLSENHKEFISVLNKLIRASKSVEFGDSRTSSSKAPSMQVCLSKYFAPFIVDVDVYERWKSTLKATASKRKQSKRRDIDSLDIDIDSDDDSDDSRADDANFDDLTVELDNGESVVCRNGPRMRWLESMIAVDSDYREIFYALFLTFIKSLMDSNKMKLARKYLICFRKCLPSMPFDLYVREGVCLLWCGKYDAAQEHFETLLKTSAKSAQMRDAKSHLSDDSSGDGVSDDFTHLYLLFADACIAHRKISMARQLMQCIRDSDSPLREHPRVWTREGDLAVLRGEHATAQKLFAKCIATYTAQKTRVTESLREIEALPYEIDRDAARTVRLRKRALKRVNELLFSAKLKQIDCHYALGERSEALAMFLDSEQDLPGVFEHEIDWLKFGHRESMIDDALSGVSAVDGEKLENELANDSVDKRKHAILRSVKSDELSDSDVAEDDAIDDDDDALDRMTMVTDVTLGSGTSVHSSASAASTLFRESVLSVGRDCAPERVRVKYNTLVLFEAGVSAHAILPNDLLFTEVYRNEMRRIYDSCVDAYAMGDFREFLLLSEVKMIQMFRLSHSDGESLRSLLPENSGVKYESRLYSNNFLDYMLNTKEISDLLIMCARIWISFTDDRDDHGHGDDIHMDDKVDDDSHHVEKWSRDEFHDFMSIVGSINLKNDRLIAELSLIEAQMAFDDEDYDDAYQLLMTVIDAMPESKAAMRYLFMVFERMRFNSKVWKSIERARRRAISQVDDARERGIASDDGERRGDGTSVDVSNHESVIAFKRMLHNSYKAALSHCSAIVRARPRSGFAHLSMAITLAHFARRRIVFSQTNFVIMKSLAHAKTYVELSNGNAESLYNFGRLLHWFGFFTPATHYYRKTILMICKRRSLRDVCVSERVDGDEERDDLEFDDSDHLFGDELGEFRLRSDDDSADGVDAESKVDKAILKHCIFNLSKLYQQNNEIYAAQQLFKEYRCFM